MMRRLGRSELMVSGLGLGCWAIGGAHWAADSENRYPMGYGEADDAESTRAIHQAIDLGVTFFDTANNYGAGHSERVLGEALKSRRDGLVIATKFGTVFDEASKTSFRDRHIPDYPAAFIREACESSLRRLQIDCIDLYQLHWGSAPVELAEQAMITLEELVAEGKIRWYGWSTDDPDRARVFANGRHCTAIQHKVSILSPADAMLAVCDQYDLASVNKSPLENGFLTGKFSRESKLSDETDMRSRIDFSGERAASLIKRVEELRAIMTEDGRSMAQAALGWIWAYHPRTIPIPGFRSVTQVEDNAGALAYGPLSADQMRRISTLLRQHAQN
jgi:aryl-alcohol dehydrogenase-like predicted oxidoreductase